MVLITLAFISEWQIPHRFHFIILYQNQHRVTDDEHHTKRGGRRMWALSPICHCFILLSFYQLAKSQESRLHHNHHFLFQWKISLKIINLWLAAVIKNKNVNQKIHKGFKYQGHQLLRYFQGLLGLLLLNPLRHKSNKWISLTRSWELGPIMPQGNFPALLLLSITRVSSECIWKERLRGTKTVCLGKQIKTDMPLCLRGRKKENIISRWFAGLSVFHNVINCPQDSWYDWILKAREKKGKCSLLNFKWIEFEASWTRRWQNYRGIKCVKLRDLTYPPIAKKKEDEKKYIHRQILASET